MDKNIANQFARMFSMDFERFKFTWHTWQITIISLFVLREEKQTLFHCVVRSTLPFIAAAKSHKKEEWSAHNPTVTANTPEQSQSNKQKVYEKRAEN